MKTIFTGIKLAYIDKIGHCGTLASMNTTLNISLEHDQKGWINTTREAGGFSSASDVIRSLIRNAQAQEQETLLKEFRSLESDGSNETEPAGDVLKLVKLVKKSRRV